MIIYIIILQQNVQLTRVAEYYTLGICGICTLTRELRTLQTEPFFFLCSSGCLNFSNSSNI